MSYQDTSLWKRTLGLDDKNVEPLRNSYLHARENAKFLLNKIRTDFKNLTVHDITHVDSLWNVADVIINKATPDDENDYYPINPLEGYILGIAFLIHDAALSYDAVGGKEKLRDTIEWKDAHADGPGEKDEEEFKIECDFAAIRAIHAREAEEILFKLFTKDNGSTFYIIDNDSYRKHFGKLIGKIAASHHWDIDRVGSDELKKQINPRSGMPNDWKINAQKLACILRCADAGHIDDGRAPDAIYQSLLVNGVSRYHWESQNHLCQVCEDEDDKTKLCITSSNPFIKEEKYAVASWHVAYDAIRIFDEELKKSNRFLKESHIQAFPHNGVSGAGSKEDLAKYVETDGWKPCNFGVHTGNIKKLIENLGGSKLYGENNKLLIVLRELIQNARDAIQARRNMDTSFHDGRIIIRSYEKNEDHFIEVEDNGIGMSMDCIEHCLLDFGSSYWKSSLSKYENPGLRSSGFTSVGKFGIGFYSVFMIAKDVNVYTRRYEEGEETIRVEFPEGLTISPIISDWKMSTNISTKVVLTLKEKSDMIISIPNTNSQIPFSKALQLIVASLDEDVYFEDNDNQDLIHRSIYSPKFNTTEWLERLFIIAPRNIASLANKLEYIKDEHGRIKALLDIANEDEIRIPYPSIETNGGLSASLDCFEKGFIGFIDYREKNISRNVFDFDKQTKKYLQDWISSRYIKEYIQIINSDNLARSYIKMISYCKIDIDEIVLNNKKEIYRVCSFNSNIVGSIDELRMVHYNMYAGLTQTARKVQNGFVYFWEIPQILVKYLGIRRINEIVDSYVLLLLIERLPNNDFESIIKKFVLIHWAKPFYDGNSLCARFWVNVMLKKVLNKMIDWEKVDNQKFTQLMSSLLNGENDEDAPLFCFLHQYCSDSYMMKI